MSSMTGSSRFQRRVDSSTSFIIASRGLLDRLRQADNIDNLLAGHKLPKTVACENQARIVGREVVYEALRIRRNAASLQRYHTSSETLQGQANRRGRATRARDQEYRRRTSWQRLGLPLQRCVPFPLDHRACGRARGQQRAAARATRLLSRPLRFESRLHCLRIV